MNFTAPDLLPTIDRTPAGLGTLPAMGESAGTATKETETGETFSERLRRQVASGRTGVALTREQQAEKSAGDLVSNALILPMLKQLRHSPWGENTVFSGGIGEKAFGPEFDMQIADRIAHSPRLGIKKALASRLLQRSQASTAKGAETRKLDAHG